MIFAGKSTADQQLDHFQLYKVSFELIIPFVK